MEQRVELRDYLRILHRNWVLLLSLTVLGGAAAFGWSLLQTPKYEATTQLYVSVRSDSSGVTELAQGTNFARQAVVSFVDVVDSAVVLDRVIDELNLNTTPQELAKSIEATSPTNSVVISVSTSNSDPALAAAIANSVGTNFADVVVNQLEKPSGSAPSLVRIETIEPALVPTAPSSPRIPLNVLIGVLGGLVLALAIAALRAVLDTRIHSSHDVESATDKPVLGGITLDPEAKKRPLIVHADPRNPRAESFRSLRTNLQFIDVDGDSRTFVISSAGPSEGKSTTTANLAIALAETGARVALVDGDLRLPRVAEYMGIEGSVGLTDVLIGRVDLADALQQWGNERLFILPSGQTPPNPSELLGSQAMQRTLEAMAGAFDYVLIDSPPLLLVTDAAVVSRFASGVLLMAASGITRKPHLSAAVERLEGIGSRLFGVIVTMLPTRGPDSYAYGSYSYAGATDTRTVEPGKSDGAASRPVETA